MKPTSARSLLWLSFFLILLGGLGMAPPAALCATILGGLLALAPTLFAPGKIRLAAVLLLLLALALSWSHYPEAQKHMSRYRQQGANP